MLESARKNSFAIGTYKKYIAQFGLIDEFFHYIGWRDEGLFNRYSEYRTWSRWEKLIFLSFVPDDDLKPDENEKVDVDLGTSDNIDFVKHVTVVVLGVDLISTTIQACRNGNLHQIPLKLFLGITEFIFYWIQLIFPIAMLAAIGFVPLCY